MALALCLCEFDPFCVAAPDQSRLGPARPHGPRAALLHDKFAPSILEKSAEELSRRQHFQNPDLYQHYHRHLSEGPNLWFEGAVVYEGPAQLCELGFTQPLTEGTNPLDG